MKQAEDSAANSTAETLLRLAKQDRKFHSLWAFGLSAHRGLFLYWNELVCEAKLAILEVFGEGPEKPFVATKNHAKILATNWTFIAAASGEMIKYVPRLQKRDQKVP